MQQVIVLFLEIVPHVPVPAAPEEAYQLNTNKREEST